MRLVYFWNVWLSTWFVFAEYFLSVLYDKDSSRCWTNSREENTQEALALKREYLPVKRGRKKKNNKFINKKWYLLGYQVTGHGFGRCMCKLAWSHQAPQRRGMWSDPWMWERIMQTYGIMSYKPLFTMNISINKESPFTSSD